MVLRVAIVGCGKIADGHVGEIRKLDRLAELVAVCDLEPLMAEQLATRRGIANVYSDLGEMLSREKLDVVHITTPPSSHLPLARICIDAGCHVYVEKPITPTRKDTVALVDYAESKGKKLTVGYSYMFEPPHVELRARLAQGALGRVVHAESMYGYNLDGPYGKALFTDPTHWVHSLPGKLLQNTIDHLMSRVIELIDDDEPRITAVGKVLRQARYGDQRDHLCDELRVFIEGKETTINATFSAHSRPAQQTLTVYGSLDTATVDYRARTFTTEAGRQLPSAFGRLVPAFERAARHAAAGALNLRRFAQSELHYFAGMLELTRQFYKAIEDDGPPPISYRDLRRIARILDEIFRQVDQTGKSVGLTDGAPS